MSKTLGILQKLDYSYNDQGWLTDINQPLGNPSSFVQFPVPMPTGIGNSTNDLFHLSLKYDNPFAGVGTPTFAQKNGNISQIQSQVLGREKEHWSYEYDYLDRLKNASHTKLSSNGALAIGQYSEKISYDGPRGNITSIQRYGVDSPQNFTNLQSGLIDNLTMTYVPGTNKLQSVTDNGEQACSSHMKWLVGEVKRSNRPGVQRGANSVVWKLCAKAKVLQRKEFKHLGFKQAAGSGATANVYDQSGERAYLSHTKWLVGEVKRSNRPAVKRGANSVVWTLCATAKVLQRITYDHTKFATISYNHLNLPIVINYANGNRIENTYTASGQKISTKHQIGIRYKKDP